MRALRASLGLLGTLALAGLPVPAGAQAVGSEFRINTYTSNGQRRPAAAGPDASGNFVVVWQSFGQDGSADGMFGQRFDSAGNLQGLEFSVNSYTTNDQWYGSVASDAGGNFVVVWDSPGQDGSGSGIFGQRFDSAGSALGSEFRVNSGTRMNQLFPSIASAASGNFVVVWMSSEDGSFDGIFGQRYDSAGTPLGSEFRVNTYVTSAQRYASVASAPAGDFVVVWQSFQDGSSYGIFGQRYDSGGSAQGEEFRVNSFTPRRQLLPSVASDAVGNIVVVWQSYAQDGHSWGIFGQRYDSAGVPQGEEFQVNSYTLGYQHKPAVACDAVGNFVVAWQSEFQDGDKHGVFGQHYDSSGVPQGGEFQINTFTTHDQRFPSVGATGINQFVVAWDSRYQDGSGYGVFGQRYDFGGAPTIHVGDLDRRARNVGASWQAQVKPLAHADGHSAESGVLVTFNVSGGVGTRTCTTTANGICEVSVVVSDSVPRLTFTVTNLSKAGFDYDAGANHDPDADSNGTSIVVNQP